eukprot:scaffold626_cov137-Pinguiococcus_pyrenoidosus.AAC.5
MAELQEEATAWQMGRLLARLNQNTTIVTLPEDASRTEAQALCSILEQAQASAIDEAVKAGSDRLAQRIFHALFQASSRGCDVVGKQGLRAEQPFRTIMSAPSGTEMNAKPLSSVCEQPASIWPSTV